MDVAQLGIKINQSKDLVRALPIKAKQKDNTILSFDQVLAMASLGNQTPNIGNLMVENDNPKSSPFNNKIVGTGNIEGIQQNSLLNISDDLLAGDPNQFRVNSQDWSEINGLLTSLLNVLQQSQITPIEDGNSQTRFVDDVHNSGDNIDVDKPVSVQNLMETVPNWSFMETDEGRYQSDPKTQQRMPNNWGINNNILDVFASKELLSGMVPSVTQPDQISQAADDLYQMPNLNYNQDHSLKINPVLSNQNVWTNSQEQKGVSFEHQDDSAVISQAIQDIRKKLDGFLTSLKSEPWKEHMNVESFLEGITSLINDLKGLNKLVLPEKGNESLRNLTMSLDQLLSVNQDEVPFHFLKNEAFEEHFINKKADPNSVIQIDANNNMGSQTYEGDGRGPVLNQPLTQQNQWSNSNNLIQSPILSVNDFVPELNEFVGRFVKINKGEFGSTEAKFSLFPENLGHVGVKILTHDGQITAQIMTETPAAKQALEGQLHQLRQALIEQGLVVQKLDIIQQQASSANTHLTDLSFSQGNSGFSREQRRTNHEDRSGKKQNNMEQLEIDNSSLSTAYREAVSKTTSNIDFTA